MKPWYKSCWVTLIWLGLCFGVALYLRIAEPYSQVFTPYGVKLTTNDAYYHIRLVDNLVANWPNFSYYDPYFVYPVGAFTVGTHGFDWLIAGAVWVVGLGHPTPESVSQIGVFIPPVLAAVTIIPVYWIGHKLFNRWVGLISAGVLAVAPGEFFGRSILGSVDQHVAEVLLSTLVVLFLLLALRSLGLKATLGWSLLSGFSLGYYLLTWSGGLLMVFTIAGYLVIQSVVNHWRGQSSGLLGTAGFILLLVALLLNLSEVMPRDVRLALVSATFIPLVLSSLSYGLLWAKRGIGWYLLTLGVLGSITLGLVHLVSPEALGLALNNFAIFHPTGVGAVTTLEMQPLFYPLGKFTVSAAWVNFQFSGVLAAGALVVLGVLTIWKKNPGFILLLVWTGVITMLALSQRRYCYYLAVNVAILSGYATYWTIYGMSWIVSWLFQRVPKSSKHRKFVRHHLAGVILGLALLVLGVLWPSAQGALASSRQLLFVPTDAWQEALLWTRGNTPEPFQGRDIYDNYQGVEPNGVYPKADYAVTIWWDYGYWVSQIARRVPSSNPSQNPELIKRVANLFLAQNESSSSGIATILGSKYIILDYETVTSKFYAVAMWGGKDESKFQGIYYLLDKEGLKPIQLFFLDYYRSLAVRLFNFNGKAVTNERPVVITYRDEVSPSGVVYQLITRGREFPSYQSALDYVSLQGPGNSRIVGIDPFVSPVPLESLDSYQLVHESSQLVSTPSGVPVPEVKIFEYLGALK